VKLFYGVKAADY